MPKKKTEPPETEPQIERFRKAVRDIEAGGELSPTEADERFEKALRRIVPAKTQNPSTE